jgi:alpha-beta hydrolase superfamily lysophospholipase
MPRKISEYLIKELERPNFVLRHQAQEYSVVRVYINSLTDSQVRLYYSKFTPRLKEGTVCIIHGYGESTDDYIEVRR